MSHVLLLSIDGFHQVDLATCAAKASGAGSCPALASLQTNGVTYTRASTSKPSDSFPGLVALVTGGTPRSTGVYYDDSYARDLYGPADTACATPGAEIVYDESVDVDSTKLDGGGGLDPAKLPRYKDARGKCLPLYPHDFLRVNTVFQVAKGAGLRTAWADKHPAYDLVNGPSAYGRGVDDLYAPEINAVPVADATITHCAGAGAFTDTAACTADYDDLKVRAVLAQIDGKDSAGSAADVPAIFGMNFQAVSVAQKALQSGASAGGYLDANGTPNTDTANAITHADASIGKMVAELKAKGLWASTLVVITAKHGQSPIDPTKLAKPGNAIAAALSAAAPAIAPAQITTDDVALVWLSNAYDDAAASSAAAALATAGAGKTYAQTIYQGATLAALFGDPESDPRVPDLAVQPLPGTIYTKSSKKIAEHGGFDEDDTHVALLVSSGAGVARATVTTPVETRQVAPTILKSLGLEPMLLQAVQREFTVALPGLPY